MSNDSFVQTSTLLVESKYNNLCNDMIKRFRSIDTSSNCWMYHSDSHQGLKSMFGKVKDATKCHEEHKKFIIKGVVFNENYTIEDGIQEIQMQMKFQKLGLSPKLYDAFICDSSVANKTETLTNFTNLPTFTTLFLVMDRKEITVKELFTKLLPQLFYENADSFIIYKKKRCNILTVLYHHIQSLIHQATQNDLQHNDLHLGNLMFDIPKSSLQFLHHVKKFPKMLLKDALISHPEIKSASTCISNQGLKTCQSLSDSFDILAFASFDVINNFFKFDSLQFIDFGHATEGEENTDLEYVTTLLTYNYLNNELRPKH
jgi:hypothetical protein